jgi:hypothetical protein
MMTTEADPAAATMTFASRWLALGGLALVGATWPLWTGTSDFPQVPLLAAMRTVPLPVDGSLLASLVAAWIAVLWKPAPQRVGRVGLLVAAAALALLILLNQHRLQPWAWQFLLVGLLIGSASPAAALSAWRWLAISIYVWSALSKLDVTFFQSHGPFLLAGLFRSLGQPDALGLWSETARNRLAAAIPLAELSVAVTLLIPRTRLVGLVGSIAMHLVLLLALGPFGHGHQPGVLLWNLFFIGQNLLLFARPAAAGPAWREQPAGTRFAWGIAGLAILLPALEPFGAWDHWPGWAVYASRPERSYVSIADADAEQLPENLQPWLEPAGPFDPWRQLRIDRWSLDAVGAPIYPQDRFAVGVALAVARGPGEPDVRITWDGPADRFTGKRTTQVVTGTEAVERFARRFRLNAQPRSSPAESVRTDAANAPSPAPPR